VQQDAIGLIKALGFIAWADERIAPEERDMLETVMAALGIPQDRRDELVEALKEGPASLEQIAEAFTDDIEKRFAIAQAILLAQVDGDFADVERAKIKELAGALEIDETELTLIYAAVEVTNDVAEGQQ
jgi:tellurite resistance protein